MEYENLNSNIKGLCQKAFDIACESVEKGKQSFSPFVIYEVDKTLTLKRFLTDKDDGTFEMALEYIENLESIPDIVILTYKDKVQLRDGKFDAIIINIYNDEGDPGLSFSQLYKIENNNTVFLKKIIFLGEVRNALMF